MSHSNKLILFALCSIAALLLMPGVSMAQGVAVVAAEAGDRVYAFENSKSAAFLFWLFAVATLGGAVFVITRRNMVVAVMGMVGTFFAIAGLYIMLYASFLAVMQVLVYAGAIMVLFVFVIMILNRPEAEPWSVHGLLGKGMAALGLLYLFKRLADIVWQVKSVQPLALGKSFSVDVVLNKLDPSIAVDAGNAITKSYDFGTIRGVGYTLFTKYLFPFEAVSIVLLVAVVGAIAIARPNTEAADTEAAEEAS